MNLLLINSNENDSFAAAYFDNEFQVVRAAEFIEIASASPRNLARSPDKLINCLVKLRLFFDFEKLDAISVTTGPGSFTGIRVGLALAKGIAGSTDKPIIPIGNFELLYERIINKDPSRKYCVLIAARAPEYYFCIIENSRQINTGCTKKEEITENLEKDTIITLPEGIQAGDFYNDSNLKHHYFDIIKQKKFFKGEHVAMLDLAKRYFLEGKKFAAENVEPVYIKEFRPHPDAP